MEIFSYHKGLNKLIEIGNSGIFRPEMLEVRLRQKASESGGFPNGVRRPWAFPRTWSCSVSVSAWRGQP